MNPDHNGNQVIEADVPMLEIYGYSTVLRSMTGGSGDFLLMNSHVMSRHLPDVQAREIEARAARENDSED